MSQSQPVIPVTMQYGGNNGHHALHHELHNIERDIHRTGDHIQREVNDAERNTIATINALANADQAQTRSSQIESRQAIERNADHLRSESQRNTDSTLVDINRNADFTNTSINRNADYTNAAIQNTSTQGLLATQDTATRTQTAIGVSSSQAERIAGETRNILNSQIQLMLMESKTNAIQLESSLGLIGSKILAQGGSTQLQAANTKAEIQLLAQQNFQATQLAQAKDTAVLQLQAAQYNKSAELQASQYNKSAELQASTYFGKLEVAGLKNTADILQKLCECCCESKSNFAATQAIVVQSGANNSANVQQGQINSLTQQLAQAQQDALFARFSALKTT